MAGDVQADLGGHVRKAGGAACGAERALAEGTESGAGRALGGEGESDVGVVVGRSVGDAYGRVVDPRQGTGFGRNRVGESAVARFDALLRGCAADGPQFKTGHVTVLVATNVAARGIHVDNLDLVVNVDPSTDHKDYLHRGGRTARAGESGSVVTLVTPNQRRGMVHLMSDAGIRPQTT